MTIKQRLAKLEAHAKDAGIGQCRACDDWKISPRILCREHDEPEPPDAWRCTVCGMEAPMNMRVTIIGVHRDAL